MLRSPSHAGRTQPAPSPADRRRGPAERRMPRRRRGALALIGSLLIASALFRAGADTSRLIANAAETDSAPAAAETSGATPQSEDRPRDPASLLEALDLREARVAERERQIEIRMQALRVAETEIRERLQQLEDAEAELRSTLEIARTAAEDDLRQLTDVYARMKPRQAAALFEEMDPNFAAGFLGRMAPEAAAAIMAGLTPPRAYTISVMLAGRNADAPKSGDSQPAEDTAPQP